LYGEFQIDPVGQQDRVRDEAGEQLARMPGLEGVNWEPVIGMGQPAAEIGRIVEENGVDLVIASTRGHSALKRLILGSVTQRLMRTLPCPVLAVQNPEDGFITSPAPGIRLKKILVGCDFSADSDLALRYALSFAQEFESDLHMVHVMEPPVYPEFLSPAEQTQDMVRIDLVKEKLDGLVPQDARAWCRPRTSILRGRPYEELVAYAMTQEMDMVVMGTRGYGAVKTLFMGSTTDRVVRRSPCPVFTAGVRQAA
jgi:nucleotide-binding universal stress UspA family protein